MKNIDFDLLEKEVLDEITKNLNVDDTFGKLAKVIIEKNLEATKLMLIKYHQEISES